MQPLNIIKDYYGEKMGFFYAWLMHYTGWLIPISMISVVYTIFTVGFRAEEVDKAD